MSAIQPATPARTIPRRRRSTRLQRKQTRLAWLMLVPALAVVAIVAIYPLGLTVYQSFTNEQFLGGLQPVEFVGLDNYRYLLDDTIFRDSVVAHDQVHGHNSRLRARPGHDHRARRQLRLQGEGCHAGRDARPLGDTDGHLGADVEVDVQRHLRRHQRRASSASTSSTRAWRGSRSRARRLLPSARSTSGRRRRSSRFCCSPACR